MIRKSKYTRKASADGWLRIKLTGGAFAFLCEYTRVEVTKEAEGRVFFKVAEGYIAVGQEGSLSKEHAAQYLSDNGPQGPAKVIVRYKGEPSDEHSPYKGRLRQQWGELTAPGVIAQVTLNSKSADIPGGYTPIPPGDHTILAPDSSHRVHGDTRGYAMATPGMVGNDIWFPIGLNGSTVNSSRYIHVGHLSEGCVTTHELKKWTVLYNYLISHRVPNSMGKYVGQLKVQK
jgi:hypothetical protein